MKAEREKTNRGFVRVEFKDLYGEPCSLQESSLATDEAIWLGVNDAKRHHVTGDSLSRMHLNREQAAWLIEELQHFVETGRVRVKS